MPTSTKSTRRCKPIAEKYGDVYRLHSDTMEVLETDLWAPTCIEGIQSALAIIAVTMVDMIRFHAIQSELQV